MTSRTHDLAAFTTLVLVLTYIPLPKITLATTVVALGANMLGGVFPDLDQPTAPFWNNLPAGSVIGRLIQPLLGSHRLISHSLLGFGLVGVGLHYLLSLISPVLIVDMKIVWWAFMWGYLSHLV